jgi:predicted membrane metal-binding protein
MVGMDLLSGSHSGGGSCCRSFAKPMVVCIRRCGTAVLVPMGTAPDWPLSRAGRQFLALAHLQLGITLLLLPVQIAMFHGFSLTSFPANLFAVPLVTFVSVPLILAGMIVHLAGLVMIESNLWYLADRSLALLFWGSGACLKGGSILMHAGNGSHFYPE